MIQRGNPFSVVANMMDCNIVGSEFELYSHYYAHFRTNVPWGKYKLTYPSNY